MIYKRISMPNEMGFYMYEEDDVVVRDFYKGWERSTISCWLEKIHINSSGMTVLDVGSYSGIYTLISAAKSRNVDVYAFEPVPHVYKRLVDNVNLNADMLHGRRISTHNIALSDFDGMVRVNITGKIPLPSGSSIEPHPDREPISFFEVSCCRGDSFFESNPLLRPVGLIKIDVERHELKVLHGLENTIRKYKPICFIELLSNDEFSGVYSFMSSLGYLRVYQIDDSVEAEKGACTYIEGDPSITGKTSNFIFECTE